MSGHIVLYTDQNARTATSALLPQLEASFPHMPVMSVDTATFLAAIGSRSASIAVIPGIWGDESRYTDLLGTEGLRLLDNFVAQGGVLMTFCAGSYLVARRTEWMPPWGEPKARTNLTPLFQGVARGPVTGFGVNPRAAKTAHDDCTVMPVTLKTISGTWKKSAFAYGNGPALLADGTGKNIEPLARYDSHPDKPIAAAWINHGKGAVAWFGALPYMGYAPAAPGQKDTHYATLMKALRPHEAERLAFWDMIGARVENHLRKGMTP